MNLEAFESRFWAITSQVRQCRHGPTTNINSILNKLSLASVHYFVFSRIWAAWKSAAKLCCCLLPWMLWNSTVCVCEDVRVAASATLTNLCVSRCRWGVKTYAYIFVHVQPLAGSICTTICARIFISSERCLQQDHLCSECAAAAQIMAESFSGWWKLAFGCLFLF